MQYIVQADHLAPELIEADSFNVGYDNFSKGPEYFTESVYCYRNGLVVGVAIGKTILVREAGGNSSEQLKPYS